MAETALTVANSIDQALALAGVDVSGMTEQEKAEFLKFYQQELDVSREGIVLRPSQIKINKDACNFVDPSGQSLDELRGVIVYKQKNRGYWSKESDDTIPECSSTDCVIGVTRDGKERRCAECPLDAWGSGEDEAGNSTRGKACKEKRRAFFILPGYQLPAFVNFSSTSLKEFDEHFSFRRTKGIVDVGMETVVNLVPAGSGKRTYAIAHFKLGAPVQPMEMMRLAKMRVAMQEAAQAMGVVQDEDDNISEAEPFASGEEPF